MALEDRTCTPGRVFVVDDQLLIREGLRSLLNDQEHLELVGEASTLSEADGRIPSCRPDVVVLELNLPDGSGIDLCSRLSKGSSGPRCLILTDAHDDDGLFAAIKAGAKGFLLKSTSGPTLIAALERVVNGHSLVDAPLIDRLLERIRLDDDSVLDPRLESLTVMERRVLEELSHGLRNREIAERIHLSESTTKNHVSAVLRKLGVSGRTEAALIGADLFRSGPDQRHIFGGSDSYFS